MEWVTKYKSLRFRLTFWNILAFLLVTFLAFFGFYIVTGKILSIHTDNLLLAHSKGIVNLVENNGIELHSMLTQEAFVREFNEIPGMLMIAMDDKGQIFNASVMINRQTAVFNNLFSQIYKNHKQFFANEYINGSLMRFLATPIFDKNNNLQGVVLMAHPIDVIARSMDSLLVVLGIIFLVLIIPVSLGGYLLVKKAVEPIVAMSNKINKIGLDNLDERVSNPKSGDELEELAKTFNLLLDRLHQGFVREKQFIADVAHELKTPLTTIQSGVEIVLSKPRESLEYKQSLQEVLVDTNKLTITLKNILDLAWSESQTLDQNETINLSQTLEDLKDITSKMAIPKNILVKSRIVPNIFVLGKSDKLGRAILNILDNAIKFTPNSGSVSLSLSLRENMALIHIKDTGTGIKKSDLPHIFDRFYRGSKTEKTLGSGLGLAIAQSIIKAHHGKIEVESKIRQGTTFSISLPLIKSS